MLARQSDCVRPSTMPALPLLLLLSSPSRFFGPFFGGRGSGVGVSPQVAKSAFVEAPLTPTLSPQERGEGAQAEMRGAKERRYRASGSQPAHSTSMPRALIAAAALGP